MCCHRRGECIAVAELEAAHGWILPFIASSPMAVSWLHQLQVAAADGQLNDHNKTDSTAASFVLSLPLFFATEQTAHNLLSFSETQKHSPLSPGGQCCCSLLLHTGTSEKANSTTTKLCQSSKLKEKQCHRRPRDAVDRNWFLFNLLLLLRYEYSFKHENIARSFYHNFQIVFFFFFRLFKQWMNAQLWHTVGGLI